MNVRRLLLLFVACQRCRLGSNAPPEADPVLSSLRSQLMADNYDYEQSQSVEKTLRARMESGSQRSEDHVNVISDNSELSDFTMDRNVLNGYMSDMSDNSVRPIPRVAGQPEPAPEMASAEWYKLLRGGANVSPYLAAHHTTEAVPYRILTGHGQSGRRSNAVLRFLQSELNDTVLVAPLLPGPLPVFQLPSSRRQYREVSDDEDLELDEDVSSAREEDGGGAGPPGGGGPAVAGAAGGAARGRAER